VEWYLQSTVFEAPHYPVHRGKRVLTVKWFAAVENEICERYSEVVGRVGKRQQHNPRE
jgi:hypothetical protein